MEEEKMKDVLDWLTPKCVKDMQKFLGLANYYHWFIEGFASIASTFVWYGEKESEMKMDGETGESI